MRRSCCLLYQTGRIGDICGKLPEPGSVTTNQPTRVTKLSSDASTQLSQPALYSQSVASLHPIPPAKQPSAADDPHRNFFWMFLSFMGISLPKAGQERRAMLMIIIGVLLFLAFIAAGILTVFRFW